MAEEKNEQSNKLFLAIVMLFVGVAVSVYATGAIKKKIRIVTAENEKRRDLELTLAELSAEEEALTKQMEELNLKYDTLLSSVASESEEYHVLTKKILTQNKKLEFYGGMTNVVGVGLRITLDDGEKVGGTLTPARIVHDSTLMRVVEALRESGAQAISINEERITATTAFTCIGSSIKVNGRRIYAPFVIKAIGDENLSASFAASDVYEMLSSSMLKFDILENINIEIQKN